MKERKPRVGPCHFHLLRVGVWVTLATAPRAGQAASIRFQDMAEESGLHFVVRNSESSNKYQIESMIAGVALFDFDNDGLLDIFFCNGAALPGLEKTDSGYFNRLFQNRGGLRFEDVTVRAGVSGSGYSMGAAAADFDNDGWEDLYVTGVNRNLLYRNRGDGTFEDVTERAGVTGKHPDFGKLWSVGAGWIDYDRDSDLDLFVVNYCEWSAEKDPYCGSRQAGYRTYCHPKHFAPLPNLLYRNNADGTFTDVSTESGIGTYPGKGMGVAFADFDLDGYVDIFVSNDTVRNFLFRNLGDGHFLEIALRSGVAYIDDGIPVSGMGADAQDYDGDGLPDIFVTALSNETFPLFRNLGNGMFGDERYSTGLGVQSLAWSGWSNGMADFDNDGWLDLFAAGGHVQTNEELYSSRASLQSNRLFRNLGTGRFEDVTKTAGDDFQQKGLHRGAAFGDLDNDGLVDAVVTRLNQRVELFHNRSEGAGNWALIELAGTTSNRDGLGGEVRVTLASGRVLTRLARSAVGFGGSSDKRIHVGLGTESTIQSIEVTWLGGHVQTLLNPPVGTRILIRQENAPWGQGQE